MIVADTSALTAIVLNEPEADAVAAALEQADGIAMSAATVAEALIVARRRGAGDAMSRLIDGLRTRRWSSTRCWPPPRSSMNCVLSPAI